MTAASPRVTVGMPVRNGGAMLADALRSVLDQTERDLEVILSDNGSTDGSVELMRAAATSDARVRYVRHEPPLPVWDHFRWLAEEARGRYFVWAAHDDTRDLDFIARLADALDAAPDAVLAFGDLVIVTPHLPNGTPTDFPFATAGMGRAARLAKLSRLQCFEIYGVWRTAAIRRVPHEVCDWGPDLPLILGSAVLGTFLHVPGPRFYYFEIPKTGRERVQAYNYTDRFSLVRGVAGLIGATFRSCADVGGVAIGSYAASLVVLKQLVNFPGFAWRRLAAVRPF